MYEYIQRVLLFLCNKLGKERIFRLKNDTLQLKIIFLLASSLRSLRTNKTTVPWAYPHTLNPLRCIFRLSQFVLLNTQDSGRVLVYVFPVLSLFQGIALQIWSRIKASRYVHVSAQMRLERKNLKPPVLHEHQYHS